jgi:hypothetical protein
MAHIALLVPVSRMALHDGPGLRHRQPIYKTYMNSWSAEATDGTRDRMTGEAKNMSDSPMLAVSMFSSYFGNDA